MYIKVTVIPDSKKEKVEQIKEDTFKIYLKEPKERGLANQRLLRILSQMHQGKRIQIVKGALTPKKVIHIL